MPRAPATAQERRERALTRAIARGKADMGLEYDCQVAELMGMSKYSYSMYKKQKFQNLDLLQFALLANTLKLTGREVCACIGVPYDDPKEDL